MLTIILGIVLGLIIGVGLGILLENIGGTGNIAAVIGVLIIAASLAIGLFAPISGYKDWEFLKETELVSLSNSVASEGGGLIYVSVSANNVYTYRYEIDSEFGTETSKEYETSTISNNVQEIEDSNCETPVLRTYTRKGKKSIWTFAIWSDEFEHVFYVPEGTISKEVKLT